MAVPLKEIVVVSGKGGTGKTSITGALASLIPEKVLADCDVDAANLQLIIGGREKESGAFDSGWEISIDKDLCFRCGKCGLLCRFDAIDKGVLLDPLLCEGCGVCVDHCPVSAITMAPRHAGTWKIWDTEFGPMVNADLGVAIENSGKLVAKVKDLARRIARDKQFPIILTDGPPGIGCPAIAAITGASLALAVVEPTVSAMHDLTRLVELTRHFRLPVAVCINKSDLHEKLRQQIVEWCRNQSVVIVGEIPYRNEFRQALKDRKTVLSNADTLLKQQLVALWLGIEKQLNTQKK